MPGVVHVSLSCEVKLQTTRSWDFLGVHYNHPTPLLSESKCLVLKCLIKMPSSKMPQS